MSTLSVNNHIWHFDLAANGEFTCPVVETCHFTNSVLGRFRFHIKKEHESEYYNGAGAVGTVETVIASPRALVASSSRRRSAIPSSSSLTTSPFQPKRIASRPSPGYNSPFPIERRPTRTPNISPFHPKALFVRPIRGLSQQALINPSSRASHHSSLSPPCTPTAKRISPIKTQLSISDATPQADAKAVTPYLPPIDLVVLQDDGTAAEHPPASSQPNIPEARCYTLSDHVLSPHNILVLEPYRVLICTHCRHCILLDQLASHLKRPPHSSTEKIPLEEIERLRTAYDLAKSKDDVPAVPRQCQPVHCLSVVAAWNCSACDKLSISKEEIRKHISGTNTAEKDLSTTRREGEDECPRVRLHSGATPLEVNAMTFWRQGQPDYLRQVNSNAPTPPTPTQLNGPELIVQRAEARGYSLDVPLLMESDLAHNNAFIVNSGWGKWVMRVTRNQISSAKDAMSSVPELKHLVYEFLFEIFETKLEDYGAYCLIEGENKGEISHKPFSCPDKEETRGDYSKVFTRFLAYLMNTQDRLFELSGQQEVALGQFKTIWSRHPKPPQSELLSSLTSLTSALFCVKLGASCHPLKSFVILSNTNVTQVIVSPHLVSPWMSRVSYFIKAAVLRRALEDMHNSNDRTQGLFDHVKEVEVFVREVQNTPFSWVKQMTHLVTRYVKAATHVGEFMWAQPEKREWFFRGQEISLRNFAYMVQQSHHRVEERLNEMCKFLNVPRDTLDVSDRIIDQPSNMATNYSFLTDPQNIQYHPKLKAFRLEALKHFLDNNKWINSHVRRFFQLVREYGKALLVAMYLGGGQNPRGTELTETLIANTPGRGRNIYVLEQRNIVNVGFLNKTSSVQGFDKPIPRGFNKSLSNNLLQYLMYIRPLETLLYSSTACGFSDENVVTHTQEARTYLFIFDNVRLCTRDLTDGLKSISKEYLALKEGWGTAIMRQNFTFLANRFLDREQNGEPHNALIHLQSGHVTETAKRHYGVQSERLANTVDEGMLRAFLQPMEEAWSKDNEMLRHSHALHIPLGPHTSSLTAQPGHEVTAELVAVIKTLSQSQNLLQEQISSLPSTLQLKNNVEEFVSKAVAIALESESSNGGHQTSVMSSTPRVVNPSSLKALFKVTGSTRFRSPEQAQAFELIRTRTAPLLVVMPTGSGKSFLYMGVAILDQPQGLISVVISPLITLIDDQLKRCKKLSIPAMKWSLTMPVGASIVFALPDQAVRSDFLTWIDQTHEKLGHIFVDECHTVLYDSAWRPALGRLWPLIVRHPVQVVLLTATLPPTDVERLLQQVGLRSSRLVHCVRMRTSRPNIFYSTQRLRTRGEMTIQQTVHNTIFKYVHDCTGQQRIIIYYRSRSTLWQVIACFDATASLETPPSKGHAACTAQLDPNERAKQIQNWFSGTSPIMHATNAFGQGIDYDHVTKVIHVGCPSSLIEYAQETGRAGRDGKRADAILLYTNVPELPAEDTQGYGALVSTIQTKGCMRQTIDGFLDGVGDTCIASGTHVELCQSCNDVGQVSMQDDVVPPSIDTNNVIPQAHSKYSAGNTVTTQAGKSSRSSARPGMTVTIQHHLSPDLAANDLSQYLSIFLPSLPSASTGCTLCWMFRYETTAKKHGHRNCTGHRDKIGSPTHEDLRAFKNKIKLPTGYTNCNLCLLPWGTTEFHQNTTKNPSGANCKFIDLTKEILYNICHNGEWRLSFLQWQENSDWLIKRRNVASGSGAVEMEDFVYFLCQWPDNVSNILRVMHWAAEEVGRKRLRMEQEGKSRR